MAARTGSFYIAVFAQALDVAQRSASVSLTSQNLNAALAMYSDGTHLWEWAFVQESWNPKQDDMPEPDDWKLLTTLKSEQVAEEKQIVFFAAPVIYTLGMAKYKLQHAEEGCHIGGGI